MLVKVMSRLPTFEFSIVSQFKLYRMSEIYKKWGRKERSDGSWKKQVEVSNITATVEHVPCPLPAKQPNILWRKDQKDKSIKMYLLFIEDSMGSFEIWSTN